MDHPLLESLASTPARIRALIEGVCETSLSHKPAPDVFQGTPSFYAAFRSL